MTTANDARKAHKILDDLLKGNMVLDEEREFLRNALPELPKQMTLEEIHEEVYEKWLNVEGDLWDSDNWGTMEEFLGGLQYQLKDLIDAPANTPALPAGMRLADHEEYGRCVVSPNADEDNLSCRIFYVDEVYVTDSYSRYVETSSLTFIDAEPAAPAHPVFLETEADYQNAPEGTIVAKDSSGSVCVKTCLWPDMMVLTVKRRVLRWGWGDK